MHVLKITELGHRFGQRVLFRKVTFTVHGGEVLGVAGPNGVGKSTLLKILAGMLRPTSGAVRLSANGVPYSKEDYPYCVGYVAPYLNLYNGLTATENLAFVARIRGFPDSQARMDHALAMVQLSMQATDRVHTYSSGMKQRLRIAVALMTDCPLLLLDEPTTNLDDRGQALYADLVQEAQSCNRIVVIASNVPSDYDAADQVISLEDYQPGK